MTYVKAMIAGFALSLVGCAMQVGEEDSLDDDGADEVELGSTSSAVINNGDGPGQCPGEPGSFECWAWDHRPTDNGNGGGGGGSGGTNCSQGYRQCTAGCDGDRSDSARTECMKGCNTWYDNCLKGKTN
jgi:hypothetical protein